jgi:transketolase
VLATLEKQALEEKTHSIMMHTIMGKGVDFMENDHNWHGVAPNDGSPKAYTITRDFEATINSVS